MPQGASISIVDDDEWVRDALRVLMKSVGVTAETFASAEEFLNSGRMDGTDCVIADVQMPGMSGPELHRQLAAAGKSIPVILITAYPDEDARARALGAGVSGYFIKPVDDNDLVQCLCSVLGNDPEGP
jgi:FixJ family two-component response regulator